MKKALLLEKLAVIEVALRSEFKNESNIGTLSGLSGISLFYLYYSKLMNDDNELEEIAIEIINKVVNSINKGYNYPVFYSGISGACWMLSLVEQEGFLELNCDDLLPDLDSFLNSNMVSEMRKGNYDFLKGGIGYALFFLYRYESTNSLSLKDRYKEFLLFFLDQLELLAEKEGEDMLKWLTITEKKTKDGIYDLGLSHGISSIISILVKISKHKDFEIKSKPILVKAINYILSIKNTENSSIYHFPDAISKSKKKAIFFKRLAWCYGDLGMALSLWNASKVLKNENIKNEALSIFKKSTKRTTEEETLVVDGCICHGSFGNALIFLQMYRETNIFDFKKSVDFWIIDGLNRLEFKDGLAGYKKYQARDNKWTKESSILEGIAGVGLVMIEYLADFEMKWSECLMIK